MPISISSVVGGGWKRFATPKFNQCHGHLKRRKRIQNKTKKWLLHFTMSLEWGAMNPASEMIKALMKRGEMRPRDLALANGMEIGTLYNVMSGAPSRQARQKLTNFFGKQIWEGIVPNEARLSLEAGSIINFATLEQAEAFASEINAIGEQRGREVRITKPGCSLTLRPSPDAPGCSEAQLDEMASGIKPGQIIEFWSAGSLPQDSAFSPNEEKSPARQRRGQGHTIKSKKASKPAAATGQPAPATRSAE